MHSWKNVFVHVDARPHAAYALEKSLVVAEAFGGRVTAFDSVSAAEGRRSPHLSDRRLDGFLDGAAAARAQELRVQLARLAPRVPVDTTVAKGSPVSTLLDYAQRDHADLIVQAVSAADVRQGTSAGMATLHLLRASRIPVWVCSPHERRSNRVLAAVDLPGSPHVSERVIRGAARVAALEGAELHVVCVANQASRKLYEAEPRTAPSHRAKDDQALQQLLGDLTSGTSWARRAMGQSVALQVVEKAVLDLEPDTVVLSRDGGDLNGLPGTHFVERLFCRVECSMLLVPPEHLSVQAKLPVERGAAVRSAPRAHLSGVL